MDNPNILSRSYIELSQMYLLSLSHVRVELLQS